VDKRGGRRGITANTETNEKTMWEFRCESQNLIARVREEGEQNTEKLEAIYSRKRQAGNGTIRTKRILILEDPRNFSSKKVERGKEGASSTAKTEEQPEGKMKSP